MFRILFLVLAALASSAALAQAVRAPEFDRLAGNSRIVLMPLDVELFTMTAGGMTEPQAHWTEQARGHMLASLRRREAAMDTPLIELEQQDTQVAELNHLHGAVAGSIALHHYLGHYELPTKEKRMDWHIGADTAWLREKTGADYALFLFVRDSYATAERKMTMFLAAMVGVGLPAGIQVGYASLVDLQTGQVVWFNRLIRGTGDLREAAPAEESITALLDKFPRQ